jgi:hypothetical protein
MSEISTTSVPRRRGDELLSLLADRIEARLVASNVYGTPVSVTASRSCRSLSCGSESAPAAVRIRASARRARGGGRGTVAPAGYIELKDGRGRFVPIVHPTRMVALVLGRSSPRS